MRENRCIGCDELAQLAAKNVRLRAALEYVRTYIDDYAEAVEKDAPINQTIWDVSSVVRCRAPGE